MKNIIYKHKYFLLNIDFVIQHCPEHIERGAILKE